jgi:hypothetical protein
MLKQVHHRGLWRKGWRGNSIIPDAKYSVERINTLTVWENYL